MALGREEGRQAAWQPRLEQLARLGCRSIRDLLFHFPRHYEDLRELRRIDELEAGQVQMAHGEVVDDQFARLFVT